LKIRVISPIAFLALTFWFLFLFFLDFFSEDAPLDLGVCRRFRACCGRGSARRAGVSFNLSLSAASLGRREPRPA
jgi:hypothetical protein